MAKLVELAFEFNAVDKAGKLPLPDVPRCSEKGQVQFW